MGKEPGGLNSVCEANTSVLGARTQAQDERAQRQLKEAIYDGKYDAGKKLFSEFVDESFLPWSRANKRSHREDEQRSVTLKAFFGEKHAGHQANDDRDIQIDARVRLIKPIRYRVTVLTSRHANRADFAPL
ncbi:MAG TPA: hypothetical protein VI306_17885 [Pyrinomonadaceae bacterium]